MRMPASLSRTPLWCSRFWVDSIWGLMMERSAYTIVFDMMRGGQHVADHHFSGGKAVAKVIRLPSGKCVVSWPTSTIIYDSERAARDVHIGHMGDRGENTAFVPVWSDGPEFDRGVSDAYQDRCEGVRFSSITDNLKSASVCPPDYVTDPASYLDGYSAQCALMFGHDWREHMEDLVGRAREVRS